MSVSGFGEEASMEFPIFVKMDPRVKKIDLVTARFSGELDGSMLSIKILNKLLEFFLPM
jgi:hypothetical protein